MMWLLQLPQRGLIALVQGYRLLLSPSLGSGCRFTPTCSAYALDALKQHGAAGGSYLAVARIARCHPWCDGGLDAVPAQLTAPKLFSRWLHTADQSLPASTQPAARPTSVSKTLP
jgi:uncharacterized protein